MSAPKKSDSKKKVEKHASCSLPKSSERDLPSGIDPGRESLIRIIGKTWVNGTRLHYCFWDSSRDGSPGSWDGVEEDKAVVRAAWNEWKSTGIGLEFEEVEDPSEAEIRIGFRRNDGSWSYIGTDVLDRPMNERTMNFGWQLHGWDYGMATALHEIGHTLSMPHSQQNPNAGIKWNEKNVYEEFSGPPNHWNDDEIFWNILRKIPASDVAGSRWDPTSIMHYRFSADLIDAPAPWSDTGIPENVVLSDTDKEFVQRFYPPVGEEDSIELKPFKSVHSQLGSGDQMDFIIKPGRTRRYTIQTLGHIDTMLVLFEKDGEENRYLASDDDAGHGFNAKITYKLIRGREYILKLRFYYGEQSGDTLILMY